MRETSTTCACCGQAIATSVSRAIVRVDGDLLDLCNRAYAEAERRAAAHVEIAHVVWCIAASGDADRWLDAVGLTRFAVSVAVNRWLARDACCGADALQTSPDLKALLERAERIAVGGGTEYAAPHHFLQALVTASSDLTTAAFAAGLVRTSPRQSLERETQRPPPPPEPPRPRAPAPARHREPIPQQLPLALERYPAPKAAPPRPDPSAENRTASERQPRRDQHDSNAALYERLERQQRELGELRDLVASLASRLQRHGDETDGDDARSFRPARAKPLGWRSRLRLRAGGWTRRSPQIARHAPPRPVLDEPAFVPPAPRSPRRGNAGSALREPMLSSPDNDTEDEAEAAGDRLKRFYLSPDDDIVKAPSIGPRTAARLNPAGLVLVRDLLSCDPTVVAAKVGARYMTADRIADWKAQARLVCTIPWLRGTHAQLLVGAGYDTIGKLMRADASIVCAAILRFASTREGQNILRSGPAPEIDRIACWIENTALAEPARAA